MNNANNNILEIIDSFYTLSILSKEQFDYLADIINSENSEARMRVCELLAFFPSFESEQMLLNCLQDRDYLVRATACDSLSFSCSETVLKALCSLANDNRVLVRGYAILSIADIQIKSACDKERTHHFLNTLLQKEKSEWVKTALYRSMCIIGDTSYYLNLLSQLENSNYRIRIFVLNLLEDMLKNQQCYLDDQLCIFLNKRYELEKEYVIKQKIHSLIKN